MKTFVNLLCLIFSFTLIQGQNDNLTTAKMENNPFYQYAENNLSNTDSIPDFLSKEEPVKITGTIFKEDGVTPAKDVILYIFQSNEYGEYDLIRENGNRYVNHRGWIKTDADGKYTFYTFVPGIVHRSGELRHIHPVIKAPGKKEQEMHVFYFDNDPLLTKQRKKRLTKKGLDDNILKVSKTDAMLVAQHDIILGQNIPNCN